MRKFILCSSITLIFTFYAIYQARSAPPIATVDLASLTAQNSAVPPSVPTSAPVDNIPVTTTAPEITQTPASNDSPAAGSPPKPTPVPVAPNPTPAPIKKPAGQYQDGQYTGSVADAYYGNVQVRATIQNNRITSVQFLQYPSDRNTSRYINSQAMPYLEQEAIAAQSANVDTVSGASDTSAAFRQSLAVALSQAKG